MSKHDDHRKRECPHCHKLVALDSDGRYMTHHAFLKTDIGYAHTFCPRSITRPDPAPAQETPTR